MLIYLATNLINGKKYVGQTVRSLSVRIIEHKNEKTTAFSRALRKYGLQSFTFAIIDHSDSIETLNEKEKYWIRIHNSLSPHGYNIAIGGKNHAGYTRSAEAIEKTRQTMIGRKHSAETKLKMRLAALGKPKSDAMKEKLRNRTVSQETKNKISKSLTGRKLSNELVERIRIGHIGHRHSEETKMKISVANKEFSRRQKEQPNGISVN